MSPWNQNIFEELISDSRFISWVSGNDSSQDSFWNTWIEEHPEYRDEFNEAVKTSKTLKFKGAEISSGEMAYSWAKISEKIGKREQKSRIQHFIGMATKVAAALLLPVLIGSGWILYRQNNIIRNFSEAIKTTQEQNLTVIAPNCTRTIVDLPDGTKVWLNSGSEISYPMVFSDTERRVKLTGEAYFEVKKSEIPFLITNTGPEIKVYGTEFNVNAYDNEDFVTVALDNGKISLLQNGKEEFIKPGQVSTFDKKNKSLAIEDTDVTRFSSWREGKYVFRNTTLSSILRMLQRQYNVNITLDDPNLGNYRYNATIKNESLEQILQLLSLSTPIKFEYKRKELKPDGTYVPDNITISTDNSRIIKH